MRPRREPGWSGAAYHGPVSDALRRVPLRGAPAPMRVARGSVVASVGLLVAVAGHGAVSGEAEPGPLGLPVALLVLAGCVVASARTWTVARLIGALIGIQAVAHVTMLLAAPGSHVDPRLAGLASSGAAHDHGHAAALTPGMLLAHLLAVAVSAVVLARVDSAVAVLWHLARRLLLPVVADGLALPRVVRVPVDEHLRPVRATVRATASSRRGPPAPLARA